MEGEIRERSVDGGFVAAYFGRDGATYLVRKRKALLGREPPREEEDLFSFLQGELVDIQITKRAN